MKGWQLRALGALDLGHCYLLCLLPLPAAAVAKMGRPKGGCCKGWGWDWGGEEGVCLSSKTSSLAAPWPDPTPQRHTHFALNEAECRAGLVGDSSSPVMTLRSVICTHPFSPCPLPPSFEMHSILATKVAVHLATCRLRSRLCRGSHPTGEWKPFPASKAVCRHPSACVLLPPLPRLSPTCHSLCYTNRSCCRHQCSGLALPL